MYLSWGALIFLGILAYLWGRSKGKQMGREEMEQELLSDPEHYNQMRYDLEPDELD